MMPTRRALCVYPKVNPCFASYHHALPFFPGVVAFMPPQGILTIAAYVGRYWEVRVVDENVAPLTEADLQWADAVLVSGMHPHKRRMAEIARAAHGFGKLAVAGGPSVSACPTYHSAFDILHIGELGDATDELLRMLDASVERPPTQVILQTKNRLPIEQFPIPAYDRIDLTHYLVLSIQWSSGCPFTCDFCDIPELYGRNPRVKSPERLLAEMDAIMQQHPMGAIWFVDDNLVGNRKAAKALMPHLIEWQKRAGYHMRLAGEASIDLASEDQLLDLMRQAYFTDMYVGIESADRDTLVAISKKQNTRKPLLESVQKLNDHGIEVSSGIIFGFDTDGPDTAEKAIAFITETHIPMVVFNLLYALPSTPLWRRLEKEGRLIPDSQADETNIRFKLPYEVVTGQYRKAIEALYAPPALYERYHYNALHTYPNRIALPLSRLPLMSPGARFGLKILSQVLWKIGAQSNYRGEFWKLALKLLPAGHLDQLVYAGAMGHHYIQFRDDILQGKLRLSTFSHREGVEAQQSAPHTSVA